MLSPVHGLIKDIINRGIADGSFRTGIDVDATAALIMQTALGAMRLQVLGAELSGVPVDADHIYDVLRRRPRRAATTPSDLPRKRFSGGGVFAGPDVVMSLPPAARQDFEEAKMAARQLPYPVFDADNHFYEPKEALTQFLPEHRKDVIDYIDVRGRTKIMVRNEVSDYIPNPTFEVVARPGAQEEYFRHGSGGKSFREVMGKPMKAIPAFREPAARLEVMDGLGLDYSLMFPTLASLVEERMKDDPELILDVVHALNEWMYETWQFNYEDRIFSTPVINLGDRRPRARGARVVPRARREDRARPSRAGARLCAAPGRSACEEFDPFWEACVKAGIPVSMHASDTGYRRVPQRLGARRRVHAVRADGVPDGRDGQAAHRGHDGGAGLPRRADPQPGSARLVDRERRRLGALPVQAVRERLHEDAAGVPGGSDRGVQAWRVRRAVLGGRLRQDGRAVRRRPGDLRFRLAASRGLGRADAS